MKFPIASWAKPRIDFTGCVLYAPLWRPDLAIVPGGTFQSKDLSPKTGTITGATWNYQGRTVDGLDDRIDFGKPAALSLLDALTIISWIKPTNVAAFRGIVSNCDSTPNLAQYSLRISDTGYVNWYQQGAVNGVAFSGTTQALVANSWQMVAATRASATGTITLYRNGVADATTDTSLGAGSLATEAGRGNTVIGRLGDFNGQYLVGTIGEALIYNRALSAAEIIHIYQVTKWRYIS